MGNVDLFPVVPVHLADLARHRLRVWNLRVGYVQAHLEHPRAKPHHQRLLAECLAAMRREGPAWPGSGDGGNGEV